MHIVLCILFSVLHRVYSLGAVYKLCHRPKGDEGVWQILILADKGGRRVLANADIR